MSTSSSAACPAASIAARTSGTRLVTPVEVSLWTTMTALIATRSAARISADPLRVDAVAPVARHPLDLQAEPLAIARHSVAKWPVSKASTRSPGESVLTSAASHAPVPDERVDDDRAVGAEDRAQALQDLEAERREARPAVVDGRRVDRPQDAVGHVGRPGDLEEVAPAAEAHGSWVCPIARE